MSDMDRAIADLMQVGGQMGADWKARREQKAYERQQRIEYARALEKGKMTGTFPSQFQQTYTADAYGAQRILRTVLLRELAKLDPNHPMLGDECRETVSNVGLILYNRANRPSDPDFADFAPDDTVLKRIYAAHPFKKK